MFSAMVKMYVNGETIVCLDGGVEKVVTYDLDDIISCYAETLNPVGGESGLVHSVARGIGIRDWKKTYVELSLKITVVKNCFCF